MTATRRRSGTASAQERQALGGDIGLLARQAGNVAAWPREAGDDAAADRVG
jgi:hypothetical protein